MTHRGYENHAKHQHGLYVTNDCQNYIIRDETKPECLDIQDVIYNNNNQCQHQHQHQHHHPYGSTYGEKPVKKTGDQRVWVMEEYVYSSEETVDTEADEFIKMKHKNFGLRKKSLPF
ncbi:hypothetical protein NE237_006807 [Protea cynaroides]|uniref:Uncharacterized protein n=1 Tax=Protea cynaroides TaxID=273540 RepID=A0A9Q0QVN4_9MAGN|nr:hypothetical protein NE237_006807 [Protea cynaroides]